MTIATICKAGVLSLTVLLFGVACAGDAEKIDGVSVEETYRAFEPSNVWTRVDYVLRPTAESFIRCRLILPPKERWTGRFWGLGNGSEGGKVWHVPSFARRGDASVHCDLGTSEGRLYRYPTAFDDYGWRATHLMTVTGKALTERFYDRKIKRAYFRGSSTGGNQGMREAMDFPGDYDGIAVDVPAQARVSMCALYWWIGRAIRDVENVIVDWVEKGVAPERLQSDDYPIAAYPDKIGGDAVSGWYVKSFGRLGFARTDSLYTHGCKGILSVPSSREP